MKKTLHSTTPDLFTLPGVNRSHSFYQYYKTKTIRGNRRLGIQQQKVEDAINTRMEAAWKKLLEKATFID